MSRSRNSMQKRKTNRNRRNPSRLVVGIAPWRSYLVLSILLLCFSLMIVRAFYLQVIRVEFLQQEGKNRFQRTLKIDASRGRITDRNGELLAVSLPTTRIAVRGQARATLLKVRHELAKILGMSVHDLNRKLNQKKDYLYLTTDADFEVVAKLKAKNWPGLEFEPGFRRHYPNGESLAHLVGIVDIDGRGLEGVEFIWNDFLRGHNGSREVIRDAKGNAVEQTGIYVAPINGNDIQLAIDNHIQYLAYSRLAKAVKEWQAEAGQVIVVNGESGEILALANYPSYNPNKRSQSTRRYMRNTAITDMFEPGSTMKPLIMAMALNQKIIDRESTVALSGKDFRINNLILEDQSKTMRTLSLDQVIEKSSNIGIVKIADKLTPKVMWQYFTKLGFNQAPELKFPGVAKGLVRSWHDWDMVDKATLSYGHGLSISLAQLVKGYTVFANDGHIIPLSLLTRRTPPDKTAVFTATTTEQVRSMMAKVVSPSGTAPKAQVVGYRVGGKTGTSLKLKDNTYTDRYISSFIGLAPLNTGHYIIAVSIDNPQGKYAYGGKVAAPVFAELAEAVLRKTGEPFDTAWLNREIPL